MRTTIFLMTILLLALMFCACGGDSTKDPNTNPSDGDADTDTDVDADADSDVDTDTGCTECPEGETCLSTIIGKLEYEDGSPVSNFEGCIKFHVKVCHYLNTDADGNFEVYKGCFNVEEPFFIDVPAIPSIVDDRTRYAVEFFPTQEQISDQGPDDYQFDVGTHRWWAIPELPTASYTAAGGASVDLSGVRFDVAPGQLGEEDIEIRVFDFPLDEWTPPFIANDYTDWTVPNAEAAYYITPYWQIDQSGDGIELSIEPPDGWTDADSGKLYILGDWLWEFVDLPGHGELQMGQVTEVGDVTWQDGRIITPPIPVLGWVLLVKD